MALAAHLNHYPITESTLIPTQSNMWKLQVNTCRKAGEWLIKQMAMLIVLRQPRSPSRDAAHLSSQYDETTSHQWVWEESWRAAAWEGEARGDGEEIIGAAASSSPSERQQQGAYAINQNSDSQIASN